MKRPWLFGSVPVLGLAVALAAAWLHWGFYHADVVEAYEHHGRWPSVRTKLDENFTGVAHVQVWVDRTGRVIFARPILKSGPAGETATAMVRKARFKPFVHAGRPVAASFVTQVEVLPPEVLPKTHVPFPSTEDAPVVMRLERGGCFGGCPIYSLEINERGGVRYEGDCWVALTGVHRGQISPEAVEALLAAFRKADFYSLAPKYGGSTMDAPVYTLTLTVGGAVKTLVDDSGSFDGMPQAVSDLEDLIDTTVGVDKWVKGNAATLDVLRQEGVSLQSPEAGAMLVQAVSSAPEPVVLNMIAQGVSVDTFLGDRPNYTPGRASSLTAAADRGNLPILKALIAAGAPGRLPKNQIVEALDLAAERGPPDMVSVLLSLRPPLGDLDSDGLTPLCHVGEDHRLDRRGVDDGWVATMLIKAGADPNQPLGPGERGEGAGGAPLFCAKTAELVRVLIGAGAKLETRNRYGDTPLLATFEESVALTLIQAGADTRVRNRRGQTIADIAKENRWYRVRWLLWRRGLFQRH